MIALLITPEYTKPFDFENLEPSLEEMQNAINGLIEVVPTKNEDMLLIVNQNAIMLNFPLNNTATSLTANDEYIYGNAIYMNKKLFK